METTKKKIMHLLLLCNIVFQCPVYSLLILMMLNHVESSTHPVCSLEFLLLFLRSGGHTGLLKLIQPIWGFLAAVVCWVFKNKLTSKQKSLTGNENVKNRIRQYLFLFS